MGEYNLLSEYESLNKYAQKGKVVFIGEGIMAQQLKLGELLEDFDISKKIYNRSYKDLTLDNASEYIDKYVKELIPTRILFYMGVNELANKVSADEFKKKYKTLVGDIKLSMNDTQVIMMELSEEENPLAQEYNKKLNELATDYNFICLKLMDMSEDDSISVDFLRTIKRYLYNSNMTVADALEYSRI